MNNKQETNTQYEKSSDFYNDLFGLPIAEVSDDLWSVVLNTLEIMPDVKTLPVCSNRELFKRYSETRKISDEKKIPISFLGYAPLFSGTRVYKGIGCDWIMMYLGEDPLYNFHKNKLYAPLSVLSDIHNIVNSGLKFDAVFVAHEIPEGSIKTGDKVPIELIAPPPPGSVNKRIQFMEKSSERWWSVVSESITNAVAVGGMAIGATAALIARDPVLFGVQFDSKWTMDSKPIGLWYYLTNWYWPKAKK